MTKEDSENKTQAVLHIFRRHQLKVTPQRVAILNELLGSDIHPAADAIYQKVKRKFPHISFDTVNRTLLRFADIGIVDIVEIFGGAKRFDPNLSNHHHLHCTKCGKIIDFKHQEYENISIPVHIRAQFTVISKRVVLKGICSSCLE